MGKTDAEKVKKELYRLRRLPDNQVCPNCLKEADGVGFMAVCVKFSTFVCSDCKSAHQSFSHRIKSPTMSEWTLDEISALDEKNGGGNAVAKRTWLAGVPEGARPKPDADENKKKAFIQRAYENKEWFQTAPADHREQQRHSSHVDDNPVDLDDEKPRKEKKKHRKHREKRIGGDSQQDPQFHDCFGSPSSTVSPDPGHADWGPQRGSSEWSFSQSSASRSTTYSDGSWSASPTTQAPTYHNGRPDRFMSDTSVETHQNFSCYHQGAAGSFQSSPGESPQSIPTPTFTVDASSSVYPRASHLGHDRQDIHREVRNSYAWMATGNGGIGAHAHHAHSFSFDSSHHQKDRLVNSTDNWLASLEPTNPWAAEVKANALSSSPHSNASRHHGTPTSIPRSALFEATNPWLSTLDATNPWAEACR